MLGKAAVERYALSVFTFHCEDGKRGEKPLISSEQKLNVFEDLGVKFCFMPNFDLIKNFSGKDFFDIVIKNKMNAKAVICGEDFRFGYKAECGIVELSEFCKESGIKLHVVSLVKIDGVKVSTSEIRRLMINGETDKVNTFLGI